MPDELLVAGSGLGDVVLGAGVDPVGVGVGDWLGGAGSRSGSHCWAVPLVTAAVSDSAAEAVLLRLGSADSIAVANPAVAATSTPPVTKLAVTGRTCAKRMKALPVLLVTSAERFFSMEWLHQAWHAQLARYAHHCTPGTVPSATVTTTQSVPN